jgi:hypothetical protein
MLLGLDPGPDLFDSAIGANEECDAMDAHVFAAHEGLFAPNAVGLHDSFLRIGQEREGQPELLHEFVM